MLNDTFAVIFKHRARIEMVPDLKIWRCKKLPFLTLLTLKIYKSQNNFFFDFLVFSNADACNSLHTITLIDLHHPFIIHDALCFCKRIIAFQLRHKPPKEEASSQIFLNSKKTFIPNFVLPKSSWWWIPRELNSRPNRITLTFSPLKRGREIFGKLWRAFSMSMATGNMHSGWKFH